MLQLETPLHSRKDSVQPKINKLIKKKKTQMNKHNRVIDTENKPVIAKGKGLPERNK